MDDPSPYLGILICLLFSAFFSGMEIAFVSSDKLHIEVMKKRGTLAGVILAKFSADRAQFLATILVCNNFVNVLYGILMAQLLEPYIAPQAPEGIYGDLFVLVILSLISTIIVIVTSEFTPKSLFMINPDFLLRTLAVPMYIIYLIAYPVVFLVATLTKFIITGIFRQEYSEDKPVFGLTDLNNYIKKNLLNVGGQEESEIDAKIFNNAIEFKTVKVRDCMIPRTEIVAIDIEDTVDDLKKEFIESGHSKILIYRDSIDDVIGYCHSLEMFKKPTEIKQILAPIQIVPESMLANELLVQFISGRKSMALVVDEYGGTSGIVSIEDIIEEIFGEIRDEHDDDYQTEEKVNDSTFLFSARLEVDYLNEKYNLNLPEGEYDTLGGLILSYHEDFPAIGEVIQIEEFTFTVETIDEKRIDRVKLTLLEGEDSL